MVHTLKIFKQRPEQAEQARNILEAAISEPAEAAMPMQG